MSDEERSQFISELKGAMLHERRIVMLEVQFNRFVADAESEKRTRAEVNREIKTALQAIDNRLRLTERAVWLGMGGLFVAQFVATYLLTH